MITAIGRTILLNTCTQSDSTRYWKLDSFKRISHSTSENVFLAECVHVTSIPYSTSFNAVQWTANRNWKKKRGWTHKNKVLHPGLMKRRQSSLLHLDIAVARTDEPPTHIKLQETQQTIANHQLYWPRQRQSPQQLRSVFKIQRLILCTYTQR